MDSLPNATQEMMVPRVREDDCFEDDRSRNVVHYDKAPVLNWGDCIWKRRVLGRAEPSLVTRNLRREQQAPSITRRDCDLWPLSTSVLMWTWPPLGGSEAKTEVLFYNRAERSLSKFRAFGKGGS